MGQLEISPAKKTNLLRRPVRQLLGPFILATCYFFLAWKYFESRLEEDIYIHPLGHKQWRWTDVTPSKDLIWHECFEDFQCARLDVPMDWIDPSNHSRVVLAVINLPATDMNDYRGPVFMNPGGPGGSGVYELKARGKAYQAIIGRNHDMISFDPRGIGASTPQVNCWPSKQSSEIWALQDTPVIDAHPGLIFDAYARESAYSSICSSSMGGNNSILPYLSTASTARDMLEILNQRGWEKLKYIGYSYGTYLGGTFAALYPERVDKMVNDGNVDYTEWSTNTHVNFLYDADKVMEAFYDFCHLAGPSNCAFYANTPTHIEVRLRNLLEYLKINPIIVPRPAQKTNVAEIITYSSVKRLISASLYRPVGMFPALASILVSLERGNGEPFLDFVMAVGMKVPFSCDCPRDGLPIDEPSELEGSQDAFKAILCADGGETKDTPREFKRYAEWLQDQSRAAGAVNVMFRMSCVGWKDEVKWRFTGPFVGNTTVPILFIANIADNVSPMRSARRNAEGFPGSVVLVQNSYGHTSRSTPCKCTAKIINAYFQNGTLPDEGTVCEPDIKPFETIEKSRMGVNDLNTALWELAKANEISLGL